MFIEIISYFSHCPPPFPFGSFYSLFHFFLFWAQFSFICHAVKYFFTEVLLSQLGHKLTNWLSSPLSSSPRQLLILLFFHCLHVTKSHSLLLLMVTTMLFTLASFKMSLLLRCSYKLTHFTLPVPKITVGVCVY